MSAFVLTYLQSEFSGYVFGDGPQLLLCFHGFGESAMHFNCLEPALGNRFTIVALDMPFHGSTQWREGRPVKPADLDALVGKILERFSQQRFSLMGYSMGGRLALCIVEQMSGQIDHVILAAPDGLKNNPWHLFVTQTSLGNRLFYYNTYHPKLFFRLLSLWRKWGFLNESVYKFVSHRMDKPEKRQLVYQVWTNMRRMMPDKKRCRQLMKVNNIDTVLLFGRYDRVIPPILGERFADGSFPCKVLVMDKGHQLLSEALGFLISKNLKS